MRSEERARVRVCAESHDDRTTHRYAVSGAASLVGSLKIVKKLEATPWRLGFLCPCPRVGDVEIDQGPTMAH